MQPHGRELEGHGRALGSVLHSLKKVVLVPLCCWNRMRLDYLQITEVRKQGGLRLRQYYPVHAGPFCCPQAEAEGRAAPLAPSSPCRGERSTSMVMTPRSPGFICFQKEPLLTATRERKFQREIGRTCVQSIAKSGMSSLGWV